VQGKQDIAQYHARTDSPDHVDRLRATEAIWLLLADLAGGVQGWDAMVCDVWADSARLIGHVQRKEDRAGTALGFRVYVTFGALLERLEAAQWADPAHRAVQEELRQLAEQALASAEVGDALQKRHGAGAFRIVFTAAGGDGRSLLHVPSVPLPFNP
jgi:hypothetical protein